MEFRIADTFTASLARLSAEDQKAAKIAATDLLMNPAQPGLQFHKLDRPRDRNFSSVRVGSDVRIIVHRTGSSLLLCYVAHHDDAYRWAERRKIETHPTTGAAQIVEIREVTRESVGVHPGPKVRPATEPQPFAHLADSELLGYGIPAEWLELVRGAAGDDQILEVAGHLPAEAAEALLNIAAGLPAMPAPAPELVVPPPGTLGLLLVPNPFTHPDAQRRFLTVTNETELRQALEFPWDRWLVFLHPTQRLLVERTFNGPARVSGSAGTGKTIVAVHRAVHFGRNNPGARVLLTTFTDVLASTLRDRLRILLTSEPRLGEQIEVAALDTVANRLYTGVFGQPRVADHATVRQTLRDSAAAADAERHSDHFIQSEWDLVVDPWQIKTWEAYRDVARLGRRTRLPEAARRRLWAVYQEALRALAAKGTVTQNEVLARLTAHYRAGNRSPFEFVIVDEAQDIGIAELQLLAALGAGRRNALFFAGDLGQRIFQQPFSWKSLGVEVRGRSTTLRVNYRTSHQIRRHADRLLGPEVTDVDGNTESRQTISLYDGSPPEISICPDRPAETARVATWLTELLASGVPPGEIAVFVRSTEQLTRAQDAAASAGAPFAILDNLVSRSSGRVAIATMHLAKGTEFRAVAVMACDDDIMPLQSRIEQAGDPADLEEVYNTERHLLYVACTRARDHLLITATAPGSEFLGDLRNAIPASLASQSGV